LPSPFQLPVSRPSNGPLLHLTLTLLYLLESLTSSTHAYLSNASTPGQVEGLIEGLRSSPPVARWTIRCYHNERKIQTGANTATHTQTRKTNMTKKVVTKTKTRSYRFGSWKDGTSASVWKR